MHCQYRAKTQKVHYKLNQSFNKKPSQYDF